MAEITKCPGGDCPLKEKCYRFTAANSFHQSYLSTPPFIIENGKPQCKMFWGESADLLFEQLKAITNEQKTKYSDSNIKPDKSVRNTSRKNRNN